MPNKEVAYFPKRLYFRFFIATFGGTLFCLFLTQSFVSYFEWQAYAWQTWSLGLIVSIPVSALLAFRQIQPLRSLWQRVIGILNPKVQVDEEAEVEFLTSSLEELDEIDGTLAKIGRKLRRRRKELAQERELSQALMGSLTEAVVILNPQGRVLQYNSRFATWFLGHAEVQRSQSVTGLQLTEVIRDPKLLQALDKVAQQGAAEEMQMNLMTPFYRFERIFQVQVVPIKTPDASTLSRILLLLADTSELSQIEKVRMEFVENASHELRTPLTSIKGYLSTARDDLARGEPAQVPRFLEIVSHSVDRLNDLVNDLLTLSQLERSLSLEREHFDAIELTKQVVQALEFEVQRKEMRVEVIPSQCEVWADSALVERVLYNLLGNAIKYCDPGDTIVVDWSYDATKKTTVLEVRDNGPGIGGEHLGRLFERFYRVDKSRGRDSGGTGLGLAIVKHIMALHRGGVRVESQLGRGSRFICEFPLSLDGLR